jgi:imidazolonepropionase-like amidohydrolase
LASVFAATQLGAQSVRVTVVKAGRLLDPRTRNVLTPAAVLIEGNKIKQVGAQMAREDLKSGITTVRNLGHLGIDGETELRDAINAGPVPGPRMLAFGRKLITRGDYLQDLNPALADAILQEFLFIDGADRPAPQSGRMCFTTSTSSRSWSMRTLPFPNWQRRSKKRTATI